VRREHDDESRHTRDDGAGQCHRGRGNARRIAGGVLTSPGLDPRATASALIRMQKVSSRLMARRKFRPSIWANPPKDETSRKLSQSRAGCCNQRRESP
jgi:hypothetical protein